jgi:hypothetical protein
VTGSMPSKALKSLVRQGIPDDLRPDLWLLFSGGLAKKKASPPGQYTTLLRKAALGASGVLPLPTLHACVSSATFTCAWLPSVTVETGWR